jgi:hypothetical protein
MKHVLVTPDELRDIVEESVLKVLKNHTPTQKEVRSVDLITRQEAADMLNVSLVTLTEWCNMGILKPYKLNTRVYFYKSQILEALQGPPEMEEQ